MFPVAVVRPATSFVPNKAMSSPNNCFFVNVFDVHFSSFPYLRIEARVEFRDVRGHSRIYRVEFLDFRVGKTKDFSRD